MKMTVRLTTRPLPRALPGVIVVVVIVLLTIRWAPAASLPLGIGGWLGSWLAAGQSRAIPACSGRP